MTGFADRRRAMTTVARMSHRLLLPLVLLVAAGAAQPAKKDAAAPSGGALLTPAQLRECNAQEARVLALTDGARREKAALEAEKAEIAHLGASLAEQIATLDRTSAEAVDGYNAAVGARDKRIDDYQAKVTAYNDKAETTNAARDAYAKACDKRRYDERDLNDLKRKK